MHCVYEVIQRELAFEHAGCGLLSLVFFKGLFGLFDKREHVAHAEDSARHAVGVEKVELVKFFAGTRERYWLAYYLFDR